jgi:DNA-binding GntR family transcriptional regulator
LKLTPGERVYCARRLRFVSGEPVAVVTSFLPARFFAGIEHQDLEKQSLYYVFEHIYNRKLRWAEELIGAVNAAEEEARELEAEVGSALLIIKETTYDDQNVPPVPGELIRWQVSTNVTLLHPVRLTGWTSVSSS